MNTADLDFILSLELIAQSPATTRSASRLLHYNRATGAIIHREFSSLPTLLRKGDLLVFNNTRVTPAKFGMIKSSGGYIEGLFLAEIEPGKWSVLLKNVGPAKNQRLHFELDPSITVTVRTKHNDGEYTIELSTTEPARVVLDRIGRMPLPPYIKREKHQDARDAFDRERYQTIFASAPGSVAAPTAALHFTPDVLSELESRGIERAFVTLDVGLGTFKSVAVDQLKDHAMHVECYTIDATAADAINRAKREGRRVIAVGTTAARTLESQLGDAIQPGSGETGIFIYPPYQFRWVDALITNFHLPRSTLIALVAALVGLDAQRRIYAEAIAQKYRFFSYGDSSFLE